MNLRVFFAALLAAAVVTVAWLAYTHWRIVAALFVLEAMRRFLLRFYGVTRPRGRSTLAQTVQAAAVAYGAWNSRWLKPPKQRKSKPTPGTLTLKSGVVLDQDDLEELFS